MKKVGESSSSQVVTNEQAEERVSNCANCKDGPALGGKPGHCSECTKYFLCEESDCVELCVLEYEFCKEHQIQFIITNVIEQYPDENVKTIHSRSVAHLKPVFEGLGIKKPPSLTARIKMLMKNPLKRFQNNKTL